MSLIDDIKELFPDAKFNDGYARVRCPYHKGGQEQHASMSIITRDGYNGQPLGTARCFRCGTVTTFSEIARDFGLEYIPDNEAVQIDEVKFIDTAQSIYKRDVAWKYSPYLESRGIDKSTQHLFRTYEDNDRVYLPVFDKYGKYLFSNSRAISHKAFFIEKGARASLAYLEEASKSKPLAICESQINALTLYSAQFSRAVATLGATKMYILKELKDFAGPFLLMFDGDEAGRKATREALNQLGAYRCIIFQFHDNEDVNSLWQQCKFDAALFEEEMEKRKIQ